MSEAEKQKYSKKKLILKIIGGMLGVFAAVYLFLVIYTNYINPPTVADGKSASYEYMKERKLETQSEN